MSFMGYFIYLQMGDDLGAQPTDPFTFDPIALPVPDIPPQVILVVRLDFAAQIGI